MKQENACKVLFRISKNRIETHVRSFAKSGNKIVIFADSTSPIMSQLEVVSNRNYMGQNITECTNPLNEA